MTRDGHKRQQEAYAYSSHYIPAFKYTCNHSHISHFAGFFSFPHQHISFEIDTPSVLIHKY